MKARLTLIVTALIFASAAGVPAEEGAAPEAIVVQGEVLDLACYIAREAKGEGHAKCAQSCLKGGQPMGLLAADGTVYLLLASHQDGAPYEAAKAHGGAQVEVSGNRVSRAGITAIEVAGVKATE